MHHPSAFALFSERRFAPFFWTQFLGALNDNVFKIGFTSLVTYHAALFGGIDGQQAAFIIAALFIAPFVLFSATSGQIADKMDKSVLIRHTKWLEVAIMLLGAGGLLLRNVGLLYACTFLMGLQSTLFGPVKYAYLPQHLKARELVGGNGLVESGTFIAILIGTIVGNELSALRWNGALIGPEVLALACVLFALLGRAAAQSVPASPSAQAELAINWNPFSETWRNLRLARENSTVFIGLLGISWLWFVGAIFLTSFFSYAKDVLHAEQGVVTLLLATFSLGIGVGSMLCERLSRGRVELGLVPFGAIGMTLFGIDLYLASDVPPGAMLGLAEFLAIPAHWRILGDLFMLAMFAGFYSVPLYALIQTRSAVTHRARIIAANNILNALFMVASSLMAMFMLGRGFTIPELFLTVALLNAGVALYVCTKAPEFPLRFAIWWRLRARSAMVLMRR